MGLIPFSSIAVSAAPFSIILEIIAFVRKIAAENREKMKQSIVIGIDGTGTIKNGPTHIFDTADVESRRVIDFEIIQKPNTPGRGNYQRGNNGMEVEVMTQMAKR
jgi:hypothetical protein